MTLKTGHGGEPYHGVTHESIRTEASLRAKAAFGHEPFLSAKAARSRLSTISKILGVDTLAAWGFRFPTIIRIRPMKSLTSNASVAAMGHGARTCGRSWPRRSADMFFDGA